MGFVIKLQNPEGYIARYQESYVEACDISSAYKWTERAKAQSFARTLPKWAVGRFSGIHEVPDDPAESTKPIDVLSMIEQGESDDTLYEIAEMFNTISDIQSKSQRLKSDLGIELSKLDGQVNDLKHYIEFTELNCYRGWQCYKALQTILRRRRVVKNALSMLQSMSTSRFIDISLERNITRQERLEYNPREFPGLFGRRDVDDKADRWT